MISTRTNESNYLKTLYLFVWHFFWGTYEEIPTLQFIPSTWPPRHILPVVLHTDDEEEGLDRHFANQAYREMVDLNDHSTPLLSFYT